MPALKPSARRPVGVLGGTFDPIHLGHLHIARAVRRAFALPGILLIPCATPPHKRGHPITEARHRVAMVRLALAGEDGLELDTREIERGGVSYTVDTLESLAAEGWAPLFILGADELMELHTWHRFDALVERFDLVAVERPGRALRLEDPRLRRHLLPRLFDVDAAPPAASLAEPPGSGGRAFFMRVGSPPVSATAIRRRAARGVPLVELVPEPVARYIREHGLYRVASGNPARRGKPGGGGCP